MTLKDYVYSISNEPGADKIALASVKLGVHYHTLRSWLHKTRTPGKFTLKHLQSKGITLE